MTSFLKELVLLSEALESTSEKSDNVKEAKRYLNKISHMLFGQSCEPVVDTKRSPDPIFYGVANTKSKIADSNGKLIKLTFDNSTDSGEFEINSLTPLNISQGSDLDKEIKSLYKRHKVHSSKKLNYIDNGDQMILREVHLGVSPNEAAVRLVKDLLKLIRGEPIDEPKKEE